MITCANLASRRFSSSVSAMADRCDFGSAPVNLANWPSIALICHCIGLVLALLLLCNPERGQSLDGLTKFLARAPLELITIGVLIIFLRAMTGI